MAKAKKFTSEDEALLSELGVEAEQAKAVTYTPKQERIIAGFEEIQRFVEEHDRLPQHGEGRDIFERIYAVRLDRIRSLSECRELLEPLDTTGLMDDVSPDSNAVGEDPSDSELLDALGVEALPAEDITHIKHVRPQAERKAAEEVAQRKPCEDFDVFKPVFEQAQKDINSGIRLTARFHHNGRLDPGDMFILQGQKVLVADSGEKFMTDFDREDGRLLVVYDNGTESNLLFRSLQRALYKDENGRRILPPDPINTPLFSKEEEEGDVESGTIYVLRSCSDNPFIVENRKVIHKIGVTGGDVKKRISNAKKDPTFLLADVEVVFTYKLVDVNRKKLEKLLHKFFAQAKMDVQLKDRFGEAVEPREWFLVTPTVIQEAVNLLIEGKLHDFHYDKKSAKIKKTTS